MCTLDSKAKPEDATQLASSGGGNYGYAMTEMWLKPDTGQDIELGWQLGQLAWKWAHTLTAGELPGSTDEEGLAPGQRKTACLARLAATRHLARKCDELAASDALTAMENGAGMEEVAAAWGVSRQAAAKRWGHLLQGERVAVVISRRSRVHDDPADPRGRYGEVGGSGQYDSDRGDWFVGAAVRARARYAIIGVDGAMRRGYRIGSWAPSGAKWQFHGTALSPEEIEKLHEAGDIPLQIGDPCPTRAGGAYRPLWY